MRCARAIALVVAASLAVSSVPQGARALEPYVAIDGSGEPVYLDFNAPLPKLVAALLRTSSYEWPYSEFEQLLARHGHGAVRAAFIETLSAITDRSVILAHKEASQDPLSPLFDLAIPNEVWWGLDELEKGRTQSGSG